jgi:hypothetical protein
MEFQPNRGSSLYKRPAKDKIIVGQQRWHSPVGTLRLSDHWNYENRNDELVYCTSIEVPPMTWVLCINTNTKPKAWKVINVFKTEGNVIRLIDFELIQKEVNNLLIF